MIPKLSHGLHEMCTFFCVIYRSSTSIVRQYNVNLECRKQKKNGSTKRCNQADKCFRPSGNWTINGRQELERLWWLNIFLYRLFLLCEDFFSVIRKYGMTGWTFGYMIFTLFWLQTLKKRNLVFENDEISVLCYRQEECDAMTDWTIAHMIFRHFLVETIFVICN